MRPVTAIFARAGACLFAFALLVAGSAANGQAAGLFNAASNTNSSITVPNTLTATFVNGATENARAAFNASTLNPFLTNAGYIGAVRNAADTWWQGWTCGLGSPTPAC